MTTLEKTTQDRVAVSINLKMMRTLMRKLIRDSRKTLIWTVIGLALYTAMILAFFPAVADQGDEFQELIDSYPEEIIAAVYSGDAEDYRVDDPAIFLQTEAMIWMVLILGAVVTVQAFNGTVNAERDHRMDLMMSLPLSRREFIVTRLFHTALTILVGLTAIYLPIVLLQPFVDKFHIPPDKLAVGVYGAFLLLAVQASLSYALGAIAPSRARWAGAVAFAYFYGAYLMMAFTTTIDIVDTISPLFIFKYYNTAVVINDGVDVLDWLILFGVSCVFTTIAIWRFERKELGV